MGKLGNIVSAPKMFLNLLGSIFASREANFVSAAIFPGVGKQGNIDRKQILFPQRVYLLYSVRKGVFIIQ